MSSVSISMPASPTKSANWLIFLAILIFSTGPLFWLTFTIFFGASRDIGSNDSSHPTTFFRAENDDNEKLVGYAQRLLANRREKAAAAKRRFVADCQNGWLLNGLLCSEKTAEMRDEEREEEAKKEILDRIIALEEEEEAIARPVVPKSLPPLVAGKRPLRIAQIAPLAESIPPKMYGGTERMVYYLTEELVRRGHQVTLFCSADSQTSAQEHISHESWPALRLNPVIMNIIPQMWMMEKVRQRADDFDILHFHTIDYFPILHSFVGRSVTTLHGIMSFKDYEILFQMYNKVPLVSISDDQRVHLDSPDANYIGTVHHGIPADLFPFTPNPSPSTVAGLNGTAKTMTPTERPYLAFLGRITEVKRPEWAIEIAVKAGIPLKIAAKVDPVDVQFWEETLKPLVEKHSDLVEYIGEISESQKGVFLGNALALLFPIDWAEPFGLVMIESMACGTPVVARPYGSVSEVVEEGISGLIFNTIDEGIEAVKRVHEMDRAQVRKAFERRFTVEKMAENYIDLYEKLLIQEGENPNEKNEL